jgi:ubiquinone/menaquinone biosynthesis C-methylase UbiE
MARKLDYEKKVCGLKETSKWAIFRPLGWEFLPKDFLKKLDGKLLDVGCGAGYFTSLIKRSRPDLEIYGVDFSRKAIEMAKKDFPEIKFLVASAHKLPFPDSFFDAVVMRQMLEHLKDPARALAEVKRVLKSGALFYSATPLEGDKLVLSPSKRLSRKYQGHLQRFSRDSLLSLLKESSFQIKRYYFSGYLFAQLMNYVCLSLYQLLGLPREFSVQGYVAQGNSGWGKWWLDLLRKFVFSVANIESRVIPKKIPGQSMHVIACSFSK